MINLLYYIKYYIIAMGYTEEDILHMKSDMVLYNNEIWALEKVKNASDLGPLERTYIDKNINYLKKHVSEIQFKIDMWERD